MDDRSIFILDDKSQSRFATTDEVFPDAQLGQLSEDPAAPLYLVVGGLVAVAIKPTLSYELATFYAETWGQYRKGNPDIFALYANWFASRPKLQNIHNVPVSRSALQYFAATGALPQNPPPPPTRPTTVPGGARPPGTAAVHGHLPFQDVTTAFEIFYRFEAWPISRRITIGAGGTIAAGTFASPASELPFLPTGFAAVARNALPSFFPAVFRYELAPVANASILCGAVVPMFGMSGGGVEVMFIDDPTTPNRGAMANPAVVLPL